jgi:hypothetical protein
MVPFVSCEEKEVCECDTWAQPCKTFFVRNLRIIVFVPCKYYQPSLMFVSKTRSLPQSGASECCFIRVGSGLTCKHKIRLERLALDKHSSLLEKSINYGQKCFITLGPGPIVIKLFTAVIYEFS